MGCALGAVVLPAFEDVLAERSRDAAPRVQPDAGRLLGVREDGERPGALAARLGGSCRGGIVEHAEDDRRILLTVATFAENLRRFEAGTLSRRPS